MWEYSIVWEKLEKTVKHWKELYKSVFDKIGSKEYRLENKLHVKVRNAPVTFKEYRLTTIKAEDSYLLGKIIKFNLIDDSDGKEYSINIYPEFELKSEGRIVNVDVIFEMIADELGIKAKEEKVTAEVTIV